jgi:hypothetical protein
MRLFATILIAFAITASAAIAKPAWTGAGWYIVEDVEVDGWLLRGPYADEETCKANRPADDDEAIYYCEYHATQPKWDY